MCSEIFGIPQGFVVCPVLKKDDKSCVKNYRFVAITRMRNFAKVFQIVLQKHLYHHMRPQLKGCHHGFISGKSTLTNFMSRKVDANAIC